MHYLKRNGILAVGTIRANRLHGCPITSNKELQKEGRGAFDYRVYSNSGIVIVKWVDNSVVQLVLNYIGVEPIDSIERWSKADQARKDIYTMSPNCKVIQ